MAEEVTIPPVVRLQHYRELGIGSPRAARATEGTPYHEQQLGGCRTLQGMMVGCVIDQPHS